MGLQAPNAALSAPASSSTRAATSSPTTTSSIRPTRSTSSSPPIPTTRPIQGRPAKVIGVDKDTDIAVIKIEHPRPLPTVKLGNSDGAQVGDWVLAIGSPFALSKTVTAGIVSAKNRSIDEGASANGVANSVPEVHPDRRRHQPRQLRRPAGRHGRPGHRHEHRHLHPVHGLAGRRLRHAVQHHRQRLQHADRAGTQGHPRLHRHQLPGRAILRRQPHVRLRQRRRHRQLRHPNGGAAKAGIKPGDVIVSIDGRNIKDGDDLVADISARKVGSTVKLGYLRNGKQDTATVAIGDRAKTYAEVAGGDSDDNASPQETDAGQAKLGITVSAIPPQMASRLGIKGGVIVTSVTPGSFADEIGLGKGAIIREINRKPITDEASYRSIVSSLKSKDDVVFVVRYPQSKSDTYVGGTLQ